MQLADTKLVRKVFRKHVAKTSINHIGTWTNIAADSTVRHMGFGVFGDNVEIARLANKLERKLWKKGYNNIFRITGNTNSKQYIRTTASYCG